jgi:uncharacterized protein YeaO (DUF488 family)
VPIRTKRWNDPPEPEDGYRLLVCRYRPRGVKKDDEPWDAWCSALAPSVELHADAYGKSGEAIAWDAYTVRYREEMARQRFWIDGFAKRVRSGETITLLCSSACVDPARCHRTLLAAMIEKAAFPEAPSKEKTLGVVRRSASASSASSSRGRGGS